MNTSNTRVAAVIILSIITGMAGAAEQNNSDQPTPEVRQSVRNSAQQEADYLATVKTCGGMEPKEKQRCVESAKQRYGEMLRGEK